MSARLDLTDYRVRLGGGRFQITGTIEIDELGTPGSYMVRLFSQRSAKLVDETWSTEDGSYTFPYLAYREGGYFVTGHDHTEPLRNAAISDHLTPEPMPT